LAINSPSWTGASEALHYSRSARPKASVWGESRMLNWRATLPSPLSINPRGRQAALSIPP